MSKILKQLNDDQNKVADTNGIMKLQAWDYGVVQDLTNKKITATVANASGFLFDIDLVSNGTEIDLDFKDSQLQQLTPDTYYLEIKVTDADGDISVFPTEGYATFKINKNLHATEGAIVPQITFDNVIQAVDEKVNHYISTIAKGDKGDTGPKGDKGNTGDRGPQGIQGVAGKDFSIVKTFPSVAKMTGDGLSDGDFVMVSSDVEDVDNAKLYIWNGKQFNFISDLSGSQGIKGETGPQGVKGDTGPQGPKGDTGVVDYTKTVNTTGDQTVAGEKTFSNKLTVNGIFQADWLYKHVSTNNSSANFLEVIDDSYGDNKPHPIGTYYTGKPDGSGVTITGNGMTGIGGGESINSTFNAIKSGTSDTTALPFTTMNAEHLILSSDNGIYFMSGQQSGIRYDGIWRINGAGYIDKYDATISKWVNIISNTSGALAQDASVVHNSGNESVTGNKTFTGTVTAGGTALTDTGWKDIPLLSGMSAVTNRYRILSGVVYVQLVQVKGATNGQDMATLPAEAAPDVDLFFPWKTGDFSGNLMIHKSTGKVGVTAGNASDKTLTYSMVTSYPVA